ncbi:hypothetical protein RvY_17720 [Ramazzottius varieornatus]|uniref:Uncharacterized protein n=1 Tax=Ramazzottius varieornatus TaxID=947166 RepID=A0A1D1W360_RAMVA|nr:hypothetical protein RvY_17720 [Ramazzottius varieornatus]
MAYRKYTSSSVLSCTGTVTIIFGVLSILWQIAELVITEDSYMFETVLRYTYAFRAAPGLWAGLFNVFTGSLAIFAARRIAWRRIAPDYVPDTVPQVFEMVAGFGIFTCILDFTLILIHIYILIVLRRVRDYEYGYYSHTANMNIIFLTVLSALLVTGGCVNIILNMIAALVACWEMKAERKLIAGETYIEVQKQYFK